MTSSVLLIVRRIAIFNKGQTQIRAYVGLPRLRNEEQKKSLKLREMQAAKKYTVEPLYNGHFGTSHFWVIFAVI